MDIRSLRDSLSNIDRGLNVLQAMVAPSSNGVTMVTAGTSIQSAIDRSYPGATITVEPGTYSGVIRPWKPVTIQPTSPIPPGRPAGEGPVIITSNGPDTVHVVGPDVNLRGLTVKNSVPDSQLYNITGPRCWLDRCVGLGDPINGQHRGIAANGNTCLISQCFIDECRLVGRDAQALMGWNGTRHLSVFDSYLSGGAEAVMFGGADPSSSDRTPEDIEIGRCTITKKLTRYKVWVQIKNAFECKNVRKLYMH